MQNSNSPVIPDDFFVIPHHSPPTISRSFSGHSPVIPPLIPPLIPCRFPIRFPIDSLLIPHLFPVNPILIPHRFPARFPSIPRSFPIDYPFIPCPFLGHSHSLAVDSPVILFPLPFPILWLPVPLSFDFVGMLGVLTTICKVNVIGNPFLYFLIKFAAEQSLRSYEYDRVKSHCPVIEMS